MIDVLETSFHDAVDDLEQVQREAAEFLRRILTNAQLARLLVLPPAERLATLEQLCAEVIAVTEKKFERRAVTIGQRAAACLLE